MALLEVDKYSVFYKIKHNKKKAENNSRITPINSRSALLKVVNGVSLEVEKSDILGIVGESGCGKTTLTKGILSQLEHTEGVVKIDGKSIEDLSRSDLSKSIQMIFQNPAGSFNPHYRIRKSLGEVAIIHHISKEDYNKRLHKLLKSTSLDEELLDRYPSQLSGGQLQRFAIVRALLVQPKVLIADEAVAALDVSIRGDILKLLVKLHKELEVGILFISHDLNVVKNICNKVVVMYLGEIVEAGDTETVYNSPQHEYTKRLLASKTRTNPDEIREHEYEFVDVPNIFDAAL
ncbi:MAG: ABC transporter ATP-binding protein [Butyrivibrio sp.]|nr:ABC transporter ATP-binding protein [Butyrivibrio sp.]